MIRKLTPVLFALPIFAVAELDIGQIVLNDDAQMIYTSPVNFALSGARLAGGDVESVSRNGDSVVLFNHQCQAIATTVDDLPIDKRSLMADLKAQLDAPGDQTMGNSGPASGNVTLARFLFHDDTLVFATNNQTTVYNPMNEYLVHRAGKNSFSISTKNSDELPNNLARIFVTDQVTTLVYKDGHVLMKPNACLHIEMKQLLQPIRLRVQQDENLRQILGASQEELGHQIDRINDRLAKLEQKVDAANELLAKLASSNLTPTATNSLECKEKTRRERRRVSVAWH